MISAAQMKRIAKWCEAHLSIHDIESGTQAPLVWNEVQKDMIARSGALRLKPHTDGTVKARQLGVSVGIECLVLGIMKEIPGVVICWINLDETRAKVIRRKWDAILQSAVSSTGSGVSKPRRDSEQLCQLHNGSALVWEVAGGAPQTAGRAGVGDTINLLIMCEMSRWEYAHKTLVAIMPAVKSTRGGVFIDSTPPEFEGQGEQYLRRIEAIRNEKILGEVFHYPWWEREDYRATSQARAPYTADEIDLMNNAVHLSGKVGLDLYQVQWLRETMADPDLGPRFDQAYAPDLDLALAPKGVKAFPRALMRHLAQINRNDAWPDPLRAGEIYASLPAPLHQVGYDMLTDVKVCRVWYLPEEAASPPETQSRSARDMVRQILKQDAIRGECHMGVDSSDGGPKSDWQSASMILPDAEIAVAVRCRVPPIIYAGLLQRLGLWFGAHIAVETNARSGALVYRYLSQAIGAQEIADNNAHPILAERYPNVSEWVANSANRPELEALVLKLFTLIRIPCKWFFDEMLKWDPKLRKARAGSVDDCFDGYGVGAVSRAHASRRAQRTKQRSRFKIHTRMQTKQGITKRVAKRSRMARVNRYIK